MNLFFQREKCIFVPLSKPVKLEPKTLASLDQWWHRNGAMDSDRTRLLVR